MRVIAGAVAAVAVALGLALAAPQPAGTAREATVVVPRVIGYRLDRATRTLRQRGLRVNEECGGLFGCVVKARWWVCFQTPRAGRRVQKYSVVVVYAERRGEC